MIMDSSTNISNANLNDEDKTSVVLKRQQEQKSSVVVAAAAIDNNNAPPKIVASVESKISLDEDGLASSSASKLNNNIISNNQQESSIKLKRCKHGRIIIKDLSKKKIPQPNDWTPELSQSKEETKLTEEIKVKDRTSPKLFPKHPTTLNSSDLNPASDPLTAPVRNSPPRSPPKSIETSTSTKQHDERTTSSSIKSSLVRARDKSPRRGRRSRTISRSRSRSRRRSISRSPVRRARSSRSPRARKRTPSRDRARSPRRYGSPSPRRRTPPLRRENRKSSRRRRNRYRSPGTHRNSSSYRDQRRSRTPRRRFSSSISISPSPRRGVDTAHRSRRGDSKSPVRDPPRQDRYLRETSYERATTRRKESPDKNSPTNLGEDKKSRTDSVSVEAHEKYGTSIKQLVHAAPLITRQGTNQIVSRAAPQGISSKGEPRGTSPGESLSARSPSSPSNDSASSDIYDPEGPVLPISPGDSPPLSSADSASYDKDIYQPESKNGDDDVPSSAVQLNQQEKYLQKLNRQERVIEEVKMALKPFYQNRSIDKEQYKDVLRKAVPKICHSKNGEINPIKIRSLVDAYVRKMTKHSRA